MEGYQSLPTEFKGGGGVTTVNCLRTDKLLVKSGGWEGGGGLKTHKNIKEPYGGCKI